MIRKFNNLLSIQGKVRYAIRCGSSKLDLETLERESTNSDALIPEDATSKEDLIEKKRNKSRLATQDRLILMEKNPYPEPKMYYHGTLRYLRRTYGRYGQASGVNPAICWPIKEELEHAKEYERVAQPFTIQQMMEDAQQKKKETDERINTRQIEIGKKYLRLEEWKKDLHNRIAKKEAEAKAAKERKARLVEEVKRHFGYQVDPKDDKFKEMLEKKEKEQRKLLKEEKRKIKEAKALDRASKIMAKSKGASEELEQSQNKEKEDEAEEVPKTKM